jgi:hypothetical protein
MRLRTRAQRLKMVAMLWNSRARMLMVHQSMAQMNSLRSTAIRLVLWRKRGMSKVGQLQAFVPHLKSNHHTSRAYRCPSHRLHCLVLSSADLQTPRSILMIRHPAMQKCIVGHRITGIAEFSESHSETCHPDIQVGHIQYRRSINSATECRRALRMSSASPSERPRRRPPRRGDGPRGTRRTRVGRERDRSGDHAVRFIEDGRERNRQMM